MVLTVLLVLDDQMINSVFAIIHMAEKAFLLLWLVSKFKDMN